MCAKKPPAYTGPLDISRMEPEARRAYQSYLDQRQRCYNPRNIGYRHNGAKGITVEYSSREFIAWWLKEHKKRPHWNRPTCGRFDHSKPYRFENIELQEMADNTAERNRRYPRERRDLECRTPEGLRLIFKSIQEAERVLGVNRRLIEESLNGTIEASDAQLIFAYVSRRQNA